MTNASSFDFEPYCIDANARTMAEFAAAMMRAIAEISVDNYGLSLNSLSSGASKARYLKIYEIPKQFWGNNCSGLQNNNSKATLGFN